MPIFGAMSFWRNISLRGGIADFIQEWRRPQPYRWHALGPDTLEILEPAR